MGSIQKKQPLPQLLPNENSTSFSSYGALGAFSYSAEGLSFASSCIMLTPWLPKSSLFLVTFLSPIVKSVSQATQTKAGSLADSSVQELRDKRGSQRFEDYHHYHSSLFSAAASTERLIGSPCLHLGENPIETAVGVGFLGLFQVPL